ncbi:MAG: DUF3768 domain-containing protein [Ktedonobacteraceae bacterium]|nr:DUF3768 domain-containing protein [Ktedonobacteraceae bacterium]
MSEQQPAPTIAQLNDAFRRTTKQIMITAGIDDLPDTGGLIQAVREFDDFSADNNPYKEHEFGALDWQDERVFWKIDYYDQALQDGEDPLSPNCRRVLTVMLSAEY